MGTVFEKQKGAGMKWFGRWLFRVIKNSQRDEDDENPRGLTLSTAKVSRSSDVDSDEGLNITVRNAMGGKIVSFRHYDHKTDRNTHRLYVIHDELDFEKELGKLITLESMRG